jgi:hypothetical protein
MRCVTRSLITNKVGSKSLITNNTNIARTVINPIETIFKCMKKSVVNCDSLYSQDLLTALNKIELDYVKKMSERKYLEISQDMDTFLALEYKLGVNISSETCQKLKILLEIARDALSGALHSRTLFTDVTELTIKNTILEKRIEDILSGKNELQAMDDTCGEFVITKTFKLAAVYSYYITLYGLPAFGVGFDTTKLTLLVDILRRQGIDPFR